jgi:cell wall-associated NlpC family hydrolase
MRTLLSFRTFLLVTACLGALVVSAPAAPALSGTALSGAALSGTALSGAALKAEIERAWATKPEVRDAVAASAAARARGEKPRAPADMSGAGVDSVRDDVVWNARWYWEFGTPYVWSTYWTPCDEYGADCECLNRLAYYWGAGMQLHYTLQGQANAGWYTSSPRRGDLVFWDYDGDGWFGPYDHTGVYTGNGYVIHASAYWGQVAWTTVAAVSAEAYGTYYINILG